MPHSLTSFGRFVVRYASYMTPEFWRLTKRILDWHLDQESDWEAAAEEIILGLQDLKHHQRIPQWADQQDAMEMMPIISYDTLLNRLAEMLQTQYGGLDYWRLSKKWKETRHQDTASMMAKTVIEWWIADEMSNPIGESEIK